MKLVTKLWSGFWQKKRLSIRSRMAGRANNRAGGSPLLLFGYSLRHRPLDLCGKRRQVIRQSAVQFPLARIPSQVPYQRSFRRIDSKLFKTCLHILHAEQPTSLRDLASMFPKARPGQQRLGGESMRAAA